MPAVRLVIHLYFNLRQILSDWLVHILADFSNSNSRIFDPTLGRFSCAPYTQAFFFETTTVFIFQLQNKFLSHYKKFVNPVQIPEEAWGRRSFCSSGMTTTPHSFSSWRSWSPGRVPVSPIFHIPNQCCGSGCESGSRSTGSTCFWASWIRILLSLSKYSNKNLDFYWFVTSFWLLIFEKWCKSTFKK